MKYLIDIGHPAHVHLFKNFAWKMLEKGHNIFFTSREKEYEIDLLKKYGFLFKSFGRKYSSPLGKVWGLIEFDIKELVACKKYKPDILISHGSFYAAHVSFLIKKPHISLEDTFNFEQLRLYKPFTEVILTSDNDHPLKSDKVIQYSGYHELAYLHPNFYQPNENVLKELSIKKNEKYAIIRFVSWQATHDIGQIGLSNYNKIKLVQELSEYMRVFISSEGELPSELLTYKIIIKPEKMHDALNYAHLYVGESSTMASECVMLGTPAIFINNNKFGCTEDQKKYGLMFQYSESEDDQEKLIKKAIELAKEENKDEFIRKRDLMLKDKIDVTAFMVWFVENYPESFRIMKEDPGYQERFR